MTDDARALAAALHDEWDRRQGEPSEPGVLCPACVDSATAILAAMPGWRLVPADAVPVDAERHEPGDPHQYRITCEVCGERGTIRLTVDPETALAPASSEP